MNQKKCPQCKNLISVNAPTCLYCGRPNKFVTSNYVNAKWQNKFNWNEDNSRKRKKIYKQIIILLVLTLLSLLIYLL